MKLWDVAAMCLLLLSAVASRPLYQSTEPAERTFLDASYPDSARRSAEERQAEADPRIISMEDQYDVPGPYPEQLDDVMDFIEETIGRLRRSSEPRGPREREQRQRGAANTRGGERKRGRGRGGAGKAGRGQRGRGRTSARAGRGCLLKEVHLNVTDLGLGYQTKEELIFRYCSGPCAEAETNYDKILNNLSHANKLDRDAPSRTCCRPVAFDDDLSFLDDNVVYHTLKKHSAKRCACV
ncbi:glial cell line-derived neurotrophic factor [Syngnathoides biaculeatus]|uniref:glial cell line-derived neurotrophic factor n=1 Tax=Syngnathoides biaculeatus TaxID=300417 RepID=UPI002ADDF4FF|nr:glial cell line-derived neurotrophic factor [Syngnathoides biaculeatus]XP_061657163.1 glial cell line-derived neurotrophic factor [Syngnathoides biaculeatus]